MDIDVMSFDKVERLKSIIVGKTGIPPHRQRLSWEEGDLDGSMTMVQCNVQDGSYLWLVLSDIAKVNRCRLWRQLSSSAW